MFKSEKTAKGNVGYSTYSQEAANNQAAEMDRNNCDNCYNCDNCENCYNCNNCYNCYNCDNCNNCNNCENCYNCTNCYNCYNCNYCNYCTNCDNCYNCTNCYNCYNCDNCDTTRGCLTWRGQRADKLISLNGLMWPVSISDKEIQIGCQLHSIVFWKNSSDETIAKMNPEALVFWNTHKELILALAEQKTAE